MYDYCIVGGGIVGKYIAHLLRDTHSIWVSGHNPQLTSRDNYQLGSYLGAQDTWQEKATGLISFPTERDIKNFPFSHDCYLKYEKLLLSELQIQSLESVANSATFHQFTQFIQAHFPDVPLQYLSTGHTKLVGPSFDTRQPYDQYWQDHKPNWPFLVARPDFFQVDYLEIAHNQATAIVGRDQLGKSTAIKAKHIILACHTPGTIGLIQQTFAKHRMYTEHMQSVGSYFSDHLQLSFGFLLPKMTIPRTSLASLFFQDREIDELRFRLEFHSAPPRENLVQFCLNRLPELSQADFFHHFIRIVAVAEFPSMAQSRLQILGGGQYRVSKQFSETMHCLRTTLLHHLKHVVFKDLDWQLLNRHQPKYYGGHLIGGMTYPAVVDETLTMRDLSNVHIAGSSTWQSGGLFNPTFTSLVFARHLVESLPRY
jgi:hypothetical protein